MKNHGAIWLFMFVLFIAQLVGSSCIAISGNSDAGSTDACNEANECDYDVLLDPAPMEYLAYFFDHVCSGDTVETLIPEVLPDSGCFVILVGRWTDVFAESGCESHCIEPGWICHYVDVETDTAWVEHRYPKGESPILGNPPEVTNPTILEVPFQEKKYRYDQTLEEWTWENPPSEFQSTLRLIGCNGCDGGSHDIVLPLE